MSITITPGTVRDGLVSQNEELENIITGIDNLRRSISIYVYEGELKGEAFTAHKAYKREAHLEFLIRYFTGLQAHIDANDSHLTALDGLTYSCYDQVQIESEIRDYNNQISSYDAQIRIVRIIPGSRASTTVDQLNNSRDTLVCLRDNRVAKLQELQDYISATNGIYDRANSALEIASSFLSRIEMTTRCGITATVTVPSMTQVEEHLAIMAMVDALFNEDGNLNCVDAYVLLIQILKDGDEIAYQVFLMLHLDERLSNQDLMNMYSNLGQRLSFYGGYTYRQAMDLLQRIAGDVSAMLMDRYEDHAWGRSPMSEQELAEQLRRVQLITFISQVDMGQWQFFNSELGELDLSFFPPSDPDDTVPRIYFRGRPYNATCHSALGNSTGFLADWLRGNLDYDFAQLKDNPDWLRYVIYASMMAAGVAKKGTAAAVYSVYTLVNNGVTAVKIVNNVTGHWRWLSNAEMQFTEHMRALGIAELGGGGAGINTPNGFQVIGTTMATNEAMINFAGLETLEINGIDETDDEATNETGITAADAINAMSRNNVPGRGYVYNFLREINGCVARAEFRGRLDEARYELGICGPLDDLSLPDLERVIEHLKG